MYAMMKSMRIPEPDILMVTNYDCSIPGQTAESFDWYYRPVTPQPTLPNNGATQQGLATYLVNAQQADGQWDDTTGNNKVYNALATGWGVLILLKGVAIIPPVAQICDCGDLEADLNQDIHLDGSCSYHPNPARTIVLYEWDFDDDGVYDTTGEQVTITGGFPAAGYYPITLRVTDNNPVGMGGPQTDTVVCEVYVHPPCLDPQADANGPYIGTPGNPVQLDASGTTDPDTDTANLTFEWDLDNDGQFDDAVGINPTHTWGSEYTGVIGLRVRDTCDLCVIGQDCPEWYTGEDIDYTTVTIRSNLPPVSDPNGPYVAAPGATITLDGTGSYDPNGDNITYSWDLDNDGNFDDSTDAMPSFTAGGTPGAVYPVCLRVEDDAGLYDIACTSVTVEGPQPGPEVGGSVQPVNKFVLLTPWFALGILLAAWGIFMLRRHRAQS
jgi:hypothetical protein